MKNGVLILLAIAALGMIANWPACLPQSSAIDLPPSSVRGEGTGNRGRGTEFPESTLAITKQPAASIQVHPVAEEFEVICDPTTNTCRRVPKRSVLKTPVPAVVVTVPRSSSPSPLYFDPRPPATAALPRAYVVSAYDESGMVVTRSVRPAGGLLTSRAEGGRWFPGKLFLRGCCAAWRCRR